MKKIKLSVAALLIAGMSYGQTSKIDSIIPMKNGVYLSKEVIWDLIATCDDMLEWFENDELDGDYSHGSYEEGWGHAYWITKMRDELEEVASKNAENWR